MAPLAAPGCQAEDLDPVFAFIFRVNDMIAGAPLFAREQIKPVNPCSADATHDITLKNNAVFRDL